MTHAPTIAATYSLGQSAPSVQAVTLPDGSHVGLALVSGALYCFETSGAQRWKSHPPGLNFSQIKAVEDLDGDGRIDILLQAGRPAEPYGAAVIVSADGGQIAWRYDVEPMSYAWYLFADHYLPGVSSKQILTLMHAYPPDKDNGYIALFEYPEPGAGPRQRWRYDFDHYTCFPSLLRTDLDGDGVQELVVETHSRMWLLDALDGAVKQFYMWDVEPANIRSYGYVNFVDLNKDGREDFLCIATFAQHHEVLLNKNGKMEKAWHYGWPESVTTGKVVSVWAEPPYADVDGNGAYEIVLSMYNSENENAWLLRVYDAVTGQLKYRKPGLIAASCLDLDGDGVSEILANASTDPAKAQTDGARLYRIVGGDFEEIWRDDTVRATTATRKGSNAGRDEAELVGVVKKNGEKFLLARDASSAITLTPRPPKETPAGPSFANLPAIVGPPLPQIFVADVDSDGRNDVILYTEPVATVLKYENSALNKVGEERSSSPPVVADLDGDGKNELILSDVAPERQPRIIAKTPATGAVLWDSPFPEPGRPGLPHGRSCYIRAVHFQGKPTPDLYVLTGAPILRSVGLDGATGAILWEKGEVPHSERYWAPTVNQAAAFDYDGDGKEDLVFTNPDYYCVASGLTGDFLLGPLYPPDIFNQPSQGLYTLPAILEHNQGDPTVCLVDGHYFQAAMTLHGKPYWHKLPVTGEHRTGCEAFLLTPEGEWLMGFGRQNGAFACVRVRDGVVLWELPVDSTCSEVTVCDIDNDGQQDFLFGTSHGQLYAVTPREDGPRVLWQVDTGAAAGTPIPADIDADEKCEIVIPLADGRMVVLIARTPEPSS